MIAKIAMVTPREDFSVLLEDGTRLLRMNIGSELRLIHPKVQAHWLEPQLGKDGQWGFKLMTDKEVNDELDRQYAEFQERNLQ